MMCGHAILAVFEDGFYQMVVYDTNSFTRIRNVPNILIKHAISRFELIEQDSQAVVYMGHDMSIYYLKNG